MNKLLQNDISFSLKVQTVQEKMNLYLSLPKPHFYVKYKK